MQAGKIRQKTMDRYLRDANRILEVLVRELSTEELQELTSRWFKNSHTVVIRELKDIVSNRPRIQKS